MACMMQPQRSNALLIKQQVLVAHEAHFAGGIHFFNCLADSLAASGWHTTVVSHCSKQLLLLHAAQRGLLGRLRLLAAHGSVEIIAWQARDSLQHIAAVTASSDADDDSSCGGTKRLAGGQPAAQALLQAVAAAALQLPLQHTRVILDVDSLQHTEVPVGSSSNSSSSSSSTDTHHRGRRDSSDSAKHPATPAAAAVADASDAPSDAPSCHAAAAAAQAQQPFLLALLQLLQQQHRQQQAQAAAAQPAAAAAAGCRPRLAVLVQNLHHLPFGPVGTAPRSAGVLQGWQQLHGLLCVSRFVAGYLEQHVLPLLRLGSSSSSSRWQPGSSSNRVFVVHPAALGAFGAGPFPNLAAAAVERLWPAGGDGSSNCSGGSEQAASNAEQQQQQQQRWAQPPVVVMLKLTREKGSDLFFALAARLPSICFLGVTADDSGERDMAAGELLPNVTLVPPAADVSALLAAAAAAVVVVPSVLLEAFGLVACEGQLRGLPVLVADAGALPEAACGAAAAVLPVQLAHFPVAPPFAAPADGHTDKAISSWVGGRRHWDSRQLLPAGAEAGSSSAAILDQWAAALQQVLKSRQAYLEASRRGLAAAHAMHGQARQLIQQFLAWLKSLEP